MLKKLIVGWLLAALIMIVAVVFNAHSHTTPWAWFASLWLLSGCANLVLFAVWDRPDKPLKHHFFERSQTYCVLVILFVVLMGLSGFIFMLGVASLEEAFGKPGLCI